MNEWRPLHPSAGGEESQLNTGPFAEAMPRDIVFLHGAGAGAYEEDRLLVRSLERALGEAYRVHYPRLPNENDPDPAVWRAQLEEELARIAGAVALVGHSFGGSIVLNHLLGATRRAQVTGAFLIATPFWGADDFWSWADGELPPDAAERLGHLQHLRFYHARDDRIVPFAHLGMFAAALPDAVPCPIESGGHQLGNDLTVVAEDIAASIENPSAGGHPGGTP